MREIKTVRIDKFLWSVRIFKTRSIASEACRKGRVFINGFQAKPSKTVTAGDTVSVRILPATFTYLIIEPIENRVSAKFAPKYIEDLTPDEEKDKFLIKLSGSGSYRVRGTGRPTKKERRDLDRLTEEPGGW